MKKIFVTGADGFVGSNLVRELISRKYEVVGFIQDNVNPITIKDLDIDIRYGDLLDKQSIESNLQNCDCVIHTAAITSIWPYRSDIQKKVNIDGTKNLVESSINTGIERFIHIGTANSFGFGTKNNPGNESKPYMAGIQKMDYMDTKYVAQQYLLAQVKENNFPAIILNPTFMFGPYPVRPGSAKMIESIYKNKVPGYTKGGRTFIAVKDVCVAVVNAVELGRIGECYILGNEHYSYKEIFNIIANVVGKKAPVIYMPGFIVILYSIINTLAARIGSFEPAISYRMALASFAETYYSSDKAVKELKMPQTSVKIAIEEAFTWLKENNYL